MKSNNPYKRIADLEEIVGGLLNQTAKLESEVAELKRIIAELAKK